jgi:uncharacterized membrane protein SirB2
MQFFRDLIQEPVERGCVFSALVGAESLYLFLLANRRHLTLFWISLLPVLAGYALADFAIHTALSRAYLEFVYPYLMALLAAIGASILVGMMRYGSDSKASPAGEDTLLFASFTALLLMLSQQSSPSNSPWLVCTGAVYLWLGYGMGLLAFWSLGHRLRHNAQSPARNITILFCILAIVGATLAGFAGGKF